MHHINISHRKLYEGVIKGCSTELDADHSIDNIIKKEGFWCSKKSNSLTKDFFIIDYKQEQAFNLIEMHPSDSGNSAFPADFRIESSADGLNWETLHIEKSFNSSETRPYILNLPLFFARYIKLFITRPGKTGSKYFTEISIFQAGIGGMQITAGSALSFKNEPVNLIDKNKNTYWESNLSQKKGKESINIDLGNIFGINRVALSSCDFHETGFPENFIIYASRDNDVWHPLIDQRNFIAEPSMTYYWNFNPSAIRYIHFNFETVRTEGNYSCRICEIEIFASVFNIYETSEHVLPNASVFQYGIVKIAKDAEEAEDSVVRSSDSRLKEASIHNKGIVQFAEDSQEKNFLAVQASDSRLKKATETRQGIVRLAKDGENSPDTVVKGSDPRLMNASETNYGIVKICPDGEYTEFGLVRGNDSRLQPACVKNPGIVRLADNGESNPNCAVQGNDKRLRDASTDYKGIVELALDGEEKELAAVQGNDKRLKPATTISRGIVELAENGEDRDNVAVQGSDKRLKDATTATKGIVELAENGEDRDNVAVQGSDQRLKDATTETKGIVEFAENGEDRDNIAVQGSDKRLKDATITSKGIARFAADGEDSENAAVQGNDKRLKNATTITKGIVELAENGEDQEGVAVQGNDKRLKNATTSAKGLVELAENGEDKEGVVVQGNDRRLKNATTKFKGIVELAENGEDRDNAVVQGSDRRLKEATTISKGIVELAEDGEEKDGVVIQGNDKRLKQATTNSIGLVELAENGEDRQGVAVQGNDDRLKTATENSYGIVRLAKNGENRKNSIVQADDRRLYDSRLPLPHNHDYAPLHHDFNSHSGTIKITGAKEEIIKEIVPPSDRSAVIYAKNESPHPGAVGITGISFPKSEKSTHSYGVLGHGLFVGVRGQSNGNTKGNIKGAGIVGISRFGAGGVFSSEHDYSLVADGYGNITDYDDSVNFQGNGKALFVNGSSYFIGKMFIANRNSENNAPVNLVEMFEADDDQIIIDGDILVTSENGGSVLARSKTSYSKGVIGVVSGNPTIIINNSGLKKKSFPIALTGKALCRVDARKQPVKPGDLIVTSDTPGCGMAGRIDSFEKTGTVIGKALDGLENGIAKIPVFIAHM